MMIFFGLFMVFAMIVFSAPIWMEFIPIEYIEECLEGEVLTGDRRDVKDGTAIYMDFETYCALHEANPDEYPMDCSDPFNNDIFRELKRDYNIVFKPKEARKLRLRIRDMQEHKEFLEEQREKEAERERACENAKRMYETIAKYSEIKKKELNEALDKNLEETAKMIKKTVEDKKNNEEDLKTVKKSDKYGEGTPLAGV